MTVTTDVQSIVYDTDGSTAVFPIPFYFLRAADITAELVDAEDNLTTLVLGTDFTITGAGQPSGGTLTATSPFAAGYKLHAYRVVPVTQESQYQQNDPFPAKTTEKALDKLTMLIQQQKQTTDRALVVPRSDLNPNTTLPSARLRANKALGFDNNGDPFAIQLTIGSIVAPVVESMAMARLVSKFLTADIFITSYYGDGLGGGGAYTKRYNFAPSGWENGGTRFIAADGAGWERKYQTSVTLRDFGARLDYSGGVGTDDSAALASALTAVAATGGEVVVDSNGVAYIATSQTIPPGVTLRGPFRTADSIKSMQTDPIAILSLGGAIALNSAATITLGGSSTVDGVLVYRAGIMIPSTNSAAFAGTAFTIGGPGASIQKTLAVGFDKLVYSNGYERLKLEWFFGDGQNIVEITQSHDVPRILHGHFWPFATYTPSAPIANHWRSGKGVYIHDGVDGAMLLDVFVYGHATRFHFKNISTIRWFGCFADGDINQPGSVGLILEGNINGLLGTGNALWSCERGVLSNMNSGQWVDLANIKFDGCSNTAIGLVGGGVDVSECQFDNVGSCLRVENRNVQAVFDKNQYAAVSREVIECVMSGTTNVIIGPNNTDANNTAGGVLNNGNLSIPGLAAASTIQLNPNYHEYFLFGEGTIDDVVGGWKGRTVIFRFTGAQMVSSSTASRTKARLNGNATYTGSVGSMLVLYHDGNQFYQIGGTV